MGEILQKSTQKPKVLFCYTLFANHNKSLGFELLQPSPGKEHVEPVCGVGAFPLDTVPFCQSRVPVCVLPML